MAGAVLVVSILGRYAAAGREPRRREEGGPAARPGRLGTELREGWSFLVRDPTLRDLLAAVAVLGATSTAVWTVFVLYAQEHLGLDDAGYGLPLTVAAGGGLAGSALAAAAGARLRLRRALVGSVAPSAGAHPGMGLVPAAAVVAALMVLDAAAATVWDVLTVSMRQATSRPPPRARHWS